MKEMKQYSAEFLGTFWLVLGGCGERSSCCGISDVGIGLMVRCARVRSERVEKGAGNRDFY